MRYKCIYENALRPDEKKSVIITAINPDAAIRLSKVFIKDENFALQKVEEA